MFRTTLRNHFPTCQAEVRQSEGLQVHVCHERFQEIQPTSIKLKEKIEPSHLVSSVSFFPQIAIAIGVLTSNRGAGRRATLADWTWHQGASAGCSGRGALLGAIVGCHSSVLWLGGG